jgi:hypothetical protein
MQTSLPVSQDGESAKQSLKWEEQGGGGRGGTKSGEQGWSLADLKQLRQQTVIAEGRAEPFTLVLVNKVGLLS